MLYASLFPVILLYCFCLHAAVCEKCGAIGVKHAFYGKERKFCSLSCARGPLPPPPPMSETRQGEREFTEDTSKEMIPVPEVNVWNLCCVEGWSVVLCGALDK